MYFRDTLHSKMDEFPGEKNSKQPLTSPHPRFVNQLTNYDKISLTKVTKYGQSLLHKYEQIDDQNAKKMQTKKLD